MAVISVSSVMLLQPLPPLCARVSGNSSPCQLQSEALETCKYLTHDKQHLGSSSYRHDCPKTVFVPEHAF